MLFMKPNLNGTLIKKGSSSIRLQQKPPATYGSGAMRLFQTETHSKHKTHTRLEWMSTI